MVLLNRSELVARLRENIVLVSFNKVNGETRNMRCTLIPSYIPNFDVEDYINSNMLFQYEDSGRLNVWDVDAQGWRSFMIERQLYVITPAPATVPQAKTVLTPAPVRQQKSYPSAIEAALRD